MQKLIRFLCRTILRDYFAGQVLNGLCANPEFRRAEECSDKSDEIAKILSKWCYAISDAMLTERERKE